MSFSLLHPALQAADTVVAVAARDPLSTAVDVAVLLMAVGVGVLALLFATVLRRVDRSMREVRRTVRQGMGPVSDRARSISDNVEFITDAVRTDVVRLNASIKALSERLHQASDHMEERVEEFNALMELVQAEAEEIFLDTAATVRGVREGARSMADPERRRELRGDGRPAGEARRTGEGPLAADEPSPAEDGPSPTHEEAESSAEGPRTEAVGGEAPPGFVPDARPSSGDR